MAGNATPASSASAAKQAASPNADATTWTAGRFFAALRELNPLRVISGCGPSTFEAICRVGDFDLSRGYLNAITPDYHWHLQLAGFRSLRSRDELHKRSGRRVLYFELREATDARPFLLIYLYREKGAEFDERRATRFADLHRELCDGVVVGQRELA